MRHETSLLFEMKLTAGSAPALAIQDLRSAYLGRSLWVEDATWRRVASAAGGGRIGAKRGQRDRSAVEKLTGVIFDWGLAIAVNGEVDVGYTSVIGELPQTWNQRVVAEGSPLMPAKRVGDDLVGGEKNRSSSKTVEHTNQAGEVRCEQR
ncbi:hypothetical protein B296_00035078 [Ensete ventricosum]|uniref:Uncharacterized protein n=1 Tax=Ensete ventricosum TaxID=4639 RepID=A0A426YUR0_ENSVE|nr:hypothetical protein B296_00035078 [Ensete ventricosum]